MLINILISSIYFFFRFQSSAINILEVGFYKKNLICFLWIYYDFIIKIEGLTCEFRLNQFVFSKKI
jgi:hypothetical protein